MVTSALRSQSLVKFQSFVFTSLKDLVTNWDTVEEEVLNSPNFILFRTKNDLIRQLEEDQTNQPLLRDLMKTIRECEVEDPIIFNREHQIFSVWQGLYCYIIHFMGVGSEDMIGQHFLTGLLYEEELYSRLIKNRKLHAEIELVIQGLKDKGFENTIIFYRIERLFTMIHEQIIIFENELSMSRVPRIVV